MDKIKRNERIAALTRELVAKPNQVMSFTPFCERFGASKSSISEDVGIIDAALQAGGQGTLQTVAGAAGGVRYRAMPKPDAVRNFLQKVSGLIMDSGRLLPGGYLYLSDILGDPALLRPMGDIIASIWYEAGADFVLTMETKGIPVAVVAANALGLPLVIARRQSKVYEGSAVNINYPSARGSIETMSLSRRAVKSGQKALIVDDFIRGGGTARGLQTLMEEFSVSVVGISVMLAQDSPGRQSSSIEKPLMVFAGDGVNEPLQVRPADWVAASLPRR